MTPKTLIASTALAFLLALPSLANAHSSQGPGHGFGSHTFGAQKFGSQKFKSQFGSFQLKPMNGHLNGRRVYSGFNYTVYPQVFIPQGCGWLKARALNSGSPYWWDRYYACKGY